MVNAIVKVSQTVDSPAFLNIRLRREAWDEANTAILTECLKQNIEGYFVSWQATDGKETNTGKSGPRRRG